MLDNYFVGEVRRISPEAPVPVFRKRSERSVLGGAANVAANLVAANQQTAMMSIVGRDGNGRTMMRLFEDLGIDAGLMADLQRSTTVKTRFLADNNQQLMRLDVEDTDPITKSECNRMLKNLQKAIGGFDLIKAC